MELWAWLGAYLLGFALLQVYLYLYFMKGRSQPADSGERTAASVPDGTQSAHVEPSEDVADTDVRSCNSCGTYNRNDPMFVFCKNCGMRLE